MTGIQKIWEWGSYFDGLMLSFVILLEVYEKLIWEWGSYFDGLMLSFVILLEVYEKLICDKGRD